MRAFRTPLRPRLPFFPVAGLAVLILGLGLAGPAGAEIYGWVDTDGSFTYSNLPPPKGARVTDVIPEAAPATRIPSSEMTRQAELAALQDRIRLLELERDHARPQVVDFPPPPQYAPPLAGSAYGYGYGYGCDSLDVDCNAYYGLPYVAFGVGARYGHGRAYTYRRGPGFLPGHNGHGAGSGPSHASIATAGHGGGGHR